MNVLILGATRGMGRALARKYAARGAALALLGRDAEDLQRTASDLVARGASAAVQIACDLEKPETILPALHAGSAALGKVDVIVSTAGIYAAQESLEASPDLTEKLLRVNVTATIRFCEAAREVLAAQGGGTLCVFSSVAGDRGRKPVAIYGASKAALSHYLESIGYRDFDRGIKVVCVKPGFVHTDMTAGLKPPPFAGQPDAVADVVLRAIDRGTPVVYAPRIWWLVMKLVKSLPRAFMRRAKF